MSTAGKVLVVLVMLTTMVWMILASGVAQLNTNGNKALHDLSEQLAKAQVDLEKAQDDIVAFRDETSSIQEKVDRGLAVLESSLVDVEQTHSQTADDLARAKYELATIEDEIKGAQAALESRDAEKQAEEKALSLAKAEVQSLTADTDQLANQLTALRQTFQATYKSNVELLGKTR